jgi:hypothetical protein
MQDSAKQIFPMSSVSVSGGSTTYTGTIRGGASNAYVGYLPSTASLTTNGNNITAVPVTASTATTLTVATTTEVTCAGSCGSGPTGGFGYHAKDLGFIDDPNGMQCGPQMYQGSQVDPYDPNVALTGHSAFKPLMGEFDAGWDFTKAPFVVPDEADFLFCVDSQNNPNNQHEDCI